jgi:hypothetical protein
MNIEMTEVEDDTQYLVALKRTIRVNRTFLRPGSGVTMKGRVIKEHQNDIESISAAAH